MRLALALGKTLGEIANTMTAEELDMWFEFDAMEPIGERRSDLRISILTAMMANIHRDRSTKVFRPLDFMPWDEEHKREAAVKKKTEAATNARAFFEGLRKRQQVN